MQIIDFFPLKGEYRPDDSLNFCIVLQVDQNDEHNFHFFVYSMEKMIHEETITRGVRKGSNRIEITLSDGLHLSKGGYSIAMKLNRSKIKWTAFDIHTNWIEFPRYGFLSNFSPELSDADERIETMSKFHVNGIQYYDWQYRHDELLPHSEEYLDLLNQRHSLKTIRKLIDISHAHNMVSMPYLVVYGASLDFWREHTDWGLFSEKGRPHLFEDFLGLMNPTYQSPWFDHISNECKTVLETLPFDGLHIDQYGEPKRVWSKDGESIDLPQAFVDFINYQKDTLDVPVVFNAVGNWPITHLSYS
ncbi:MAG: hypothetical protein J7L73_09495, partial [Anaerolineales bacterium]|nr:hypothetical protein [Anaerolineales bacterium]